MSSLSTALGFHPGSLSSASTITAEVAIKLEQLLGRDVFPRELFRPDLFLTQE